MRAFLRCLNVAFVDDEIAAGTTEPVDVSFREARFQIMEMVGDKKRGLDWKIREQRYRDAKKAADVVEPYSSSTPISFAEISRRVHGEFLNYAAIGIWNRPRQWCRQA